MRIGIDARFYGYQAKGLGRYTENLLKNLEIQDSQNEYFVFLLPNGYYSYSPLKKNFRKILVKYPWYSLKEQLFLAQKLNYFNLDLMHFLHFNVPLFYQKKFIITLHDFALFDFPTNKVFLLKKIFYSWKNLFFRLIFKSAVRRSDKIIVDSENGKERLEQYYPQSSSKIQVINLGI